MKYTECRGGAAPPQISQPISLRNTREWRDRLLKANTRRMAMMIGGQWGGGTPPLLEYNHWRCRWLFCWDVMRGWRCSLTGLQPALNVTLQHRHKNVCTCAYTYMNICIYTCIIYRDAFCHELKVFIKYLLKKKNTPSLLNLHSSPSLFPANGQAALNVGRILWWYCFSVCFCFVFTLLKGCDTSLAPPIAL